MSRARRKLRVMSAPSWHTVLATELGMSPQVTQILASQLRAQTKASAGIDLEDGYHAFLPPDGGFTVVYLTANQHEIATVDGDLVGPSAEAFPATLAWRSRSGASPRLTRDRPTDDLEFFWLEFPFADLASIARIPTDAISGLAKLAFTVDWDVVTLPDVWLQLLAHGRWSEDQTMALIAALDAGIAAWNAGSTDRIHHRGAPEFDATGRMLLLPLDLGPAGLLGLAEVLRRVSESAAGKWIARCRVGHRLNV